MKSKIYSIFLLFICIYTSNLNAQSKLANKWYLGVNAGIDFNTSPISTFYNKNINTTESSSSICDSNGNILLYTDGNTLWNKYDSIVENGDKTLLADQSSTQGVMILNHPDNDSIYYIVTTSGGSQSYYSIVNIKANNNKCKIIKLNIPLVSDGEEKLAATAHSNGKDIWIVMHGANNDAFYFYLLTKNGLIECPKIINIGMIHNFSISNSPGAMKYSFDGNKIAISTDLGNTIEVYDFDNLNCQMFNKVIINKLNRAYGLEFSYSTRYLYVTEIGYIPDKRLMQYDLSSKDEKTINSSHQTILTLPIQSSFGGLQIAKDKKIYTVSTEINHIGIISSPDISGLGCNYNDSALKLPNNAYSIFGMSSFPSHYFYQPSINYIYDMNCGSNMAVFEAQDTFNAKQHQWIIASVFTKDTLNGKSVSYTFKDSGYYDVLLIATNGSYTDSVTKRIYIDKDFSLGHDTVLCNDTIYWLNAGDGICYKWQDSSLNQNYKVKKTGKYYVSYYNQRMCLVSDTIYIVINEKPVKPVIYRIGNNLRTFSKAYVYHWIKDGNYIIGEVDSLLNIKQKGIYQLIIEDSNGCLSAISDTLNVSEYTGVKQIEFQRLIAYPNPFQNNISIEIENYNNDIKIYNHLGEIIYIGNCKNIDAQKWPSGVYYLGYEINNDLKHFKIIKL